MCDLNVENNNCVGGRVAGVFSYHLWKSRTKVFAWSISILTEVLHGFPPSFMKTPVQYLKLGHDCDIPHSLHFLPFGAI
jgi:hypothetical protein